MNVVIRLLIIALVVVSNVRALADALTLSGVVTDRKTHAPIAQANVSLVGGLAVHDEVTDEKGIFILILISTVKSGQVVRLRIQKDGYKAYDERVSVAVELPLQISLMPGTHSKPGQSKRGTNEQPPTAHAGHANPQSPPKSGNQEHADDKPPTLSDLFTKDFPNTMKVTDDTVFIQWKDTGGILHIKRQLYLDFPAKTKFVGFYIPSSDPLDGTKTAVACLKLSEVDAAQQALSDLSKNTVIGFGSGEQMNTIPELTFSGRVFIYHDDFLSIPQKAAILEAFSAKHYDVTFMGTDHLRDAITAWYQEHNAKEAP